VQGQTKKKLVTVVWSKRKSCCRIMLHCPVCRPERVSTWWNLDEDRNIDETRWTGPNCSEIRSNPSAVTDGYLTATEPLPLTSVAKRQLAHKSIFRLFILSKSWRASTWFTCVGHCKKLLQLELSAKNKLGWPLQMLHANFNHCKHHVQHAHECRDKTMMTTTIKHIIAHKHFIPCLLSLQDVILNVLATSPPSKASSGTLQHCLTHAIFGHLL